MSAEPIDVSDLLVAKSDQLNAADLGAPITCQIERVTRTKGATQQQLSIHLVGRTGKPWKPCKGMIRLLCVLWGVDGAAWAGRWVRLYNDLEVRWAGEPSGGIRVSGASGLDKPRIIPVPIAKGATKQYRVDPLTAPEPPKHIAPIDPLLAALASLGLTIEALDAATPEGTPRPSTSTGERRAKLATWLQSPAAAERIAAARAHTTGAAP